MDLKPIVEKQGFHLLWKDIAQGSAKHLLRALASWMDPPVRGGVVLDLGDGIVMLLFGDYQLPAIGQSVVLGLVVADLKEIAWRGIARFRDKTTLRLQVLQDSCQHTFMVLSCQKELKSIHQHEYARKLLLKLERARIGHHPLNGDLPISRFPASKGNHLRHDIHTRDLIALRSHV